MVMLKDPVPLGFADIELSNVNAAIAAAEAAYPEIPHWSAIYTVMEPVAYPVNWVTPIQEHNLLPIVLEPSQTFEFHTLTGHDWLTVDRGESMIGFLVQCQVIQASLPYGDIDEDGDVDLADFSVLKNSFGLPKSFFTIDKFTGDLDCSRDVDLADFNILKGNFGSVEVVPEPTTLLLGLVGLAAVSRRRR